MSKCPIGDEKESQLIGDFNFDPAADAVMQAQGGHIHFLIRPEESLRHRGDPYRDQGRPGLGVSSPGLGSHLGQTPLSPISRTLLPLSMKWDPSIQNSRKPNRTRAISTTSPPETSLSETTSPPETRSLPETTSVTSQYKKGRSNSHRIGSGHSSSTSIFPSPPGGSVTGTASVCGPGTAGSLAPTTRCRRRSVRL